MSEKMPKDQGMWNAVFSFLFLALFLFLYFVLTDGFDRLKWIFFINTFDVIILSLATYRIIRLVTYDKIFAFVRNWFLDEKDGKMEKPSKGPRRTVAELIECIWCTGLWGALGVTIVYFAFPIGRLFVIILAVAAVGSFLQNFSQMVARIGNK
ncbi:MAG: hypothetical protein COU33_02315 [Candidatus Magasanikbacteria bacterium CG10_big_fil_rev_8_21_14_0_10_43_6]|uniref:DUF1360 domain-containing protein n=1 Tax=Candidatus Magasanikbacteria bacterium CG10_big_fil_rev_8_21_14_0_10_43_6 TaxID=1974650 RepID=A0A2M6W199_9BACT|nr:MAG: hypothetical protein COU33_02315 [Candidatus Magasanikbacteria bacterium CG10_big_fil_rev_8_21_14_0_10_43_6]